MCRCDQSFTRASIVLDIAHTMMHKPLHIVARDISQETDIPLLQQAVRLLEHENRRLVQEIATLTRELAELHKRLNSI